MPLFPEPLNDGGYNLSRIPRSWRISHILLCITGVNNVFFIKSLPRWLRVASLVYHAVWFCSSVPVVVLYIHQIQWRGSLNNILEHVTMVIYLSYLTTLGTGHMFNALKANRTGNFLREWCLFCSDETICCEKENNKRYKRVRAALVITCVSIITWYVTMVVRYFFSFDWSLCGSVMFPSLKTYNWFLKIVCMYHHLLCYFSTFSVVLTACQFALLTLTLAEEFDKLYGAICIDIHVSSTTTDVNVWEQVRFRHQALVSLVCLHGQLSSMLLGLILVGNVVFLCFNLYYVFMVQLGVVGMITVTLAMVVLSTIIIPSNILEDEVCEVSIYTMRT